jgi:glycosyltransferase involved in cell wall biosynthesis
MDLPRLNIGVTTFNRLALTRKCLASLKKHTRWPHTLTVVDNGSTDGTPAFLSRLHADGLIDRLFLLPENRGVSVAANLAWAAGDEPFFLKLDNDMEITSPGWVEAALGPMLRAGVAALAGPRLPGSSHPFETTELPGGERALAALSSLSGAALFIPREAREELGWFNEDYGLYGHEDADYSHRAKLAGYRLLAFDTPGVMRHLGEYREGVAYDDFKASARGDGAGLDRLQPFPLNAYLFSFGLRDLSVRRRFLPRSGPDGTLAFDPDPDYAALREFLDRAAALIEAVPLAERERYTGGAECRERLLALRRALLPEPRTLPLALR